jgi:hypothetical protein
LKGSPTGVPLFVSNNPEHVEGFGVLAGIPYPSLSLAKAERREGAPLAQWTGGTVDSACPNGGLKTFGAYLAHILPSSLGAGRRLTFAVVAESNATVKVRGTLGTTDWSVGGAPRTIRTDWLGAEIAKSFFFSGNQPVRTIEAKAGQLVVIESIPVTSLVEGRFHLESDACLYPFTVAHDAPLGSQLPGHYAPGDVKWPGWYQGRGHGRAAGVYEADGWTGTQTVAIAQTPSVQGIGLLSAKESMRALARHGDSAEVLFGNYGVLYDQTVVLENQTGACANVTLDFVSYVDREDRPDRTPTVQFFQSTPSVQTPTMFWNGPLATATSGQQKLFHPVLRYAPTSSELADPTLAVGSMRHTIAALRMQPGQAETVQVRLPVTGYIVAPVALTVQAAACEGAANGCGAVSADGMCHGDVLTWCESGQLRSLNCAPAGKTCGWDSTQAFHSCLGTSSPAPTPVPAPPSGCGSITLEGLCNGQVLSHCEQDQLKTIDCAAQGQTCGWNDAKSHYDCVSLADCGQITFEGACDGTALSWCAGGRLMHLDCSGQGRSCAWSHEKGYYDCL